MNRSLLAVAAPSVLLAAAAAQGPFGFSPDCPMPLLGTARDACVGDVDGDGDVDMIVAGDTVGPNLLFLNDGRGGFVDATVGRLTTPTVPPPGASFANGTHQVDLADIDGDGDLDLLVGNSHELSNRVHLNSGAGVFTDVTATHLPVHENWAKDQVVGDFDGDGDVDWVILTEAGLGQVFVNNGSGVFATGATLPQAATTSATNASAHRAFAADLDQDGDLDVVANCFGFSLLAGLILVNQGNATFTVQGLVQPDGSVSGADVNGDGRTDLVISSSSGINGVVRMNLGGLTFAPPIALPAIPRVTLDFDGDGDVDLLGDTQLMLNDGTGALTAVPNGLAATSGLGSSSWLLAADIDGDGDPDVIDQATGWFGSARVNFRTQIRSFGAAVIGQSYSLAMYGGTTAAPALFALGFSFAGTAVSLPPFAGTLRLDPAQGYLLGAFAGVGSSPAIFSMTIPNQPVFVGVQMHFQALAARAGQAPFLSNAVRSIVQ